MRDSGLGTVAAMLTVLALVKPTSCAMAQTGDRPFFAQASGVFARLPTLDRNEASLELMATGDFNGMASGRLGPRLYDATVSFQRRHDLDPNGLLTPETRVALSDEGSRIFNSWGFEFLDHPVAEASVAIPARFGFDRTRTSHGYALVNQTGTMSIDFAYFADGEAALDQVFQNLTRMAPDRQVELEVLRPTFLAVSGTSGGKPFYARWIVVQNGIAGFTLSWSRNAFPNAGRIATVMANELYPRRMIEGGGKEPGLAEAMPGDRDGPRFESDPGTGRTPLNDDMDPLSQDALRRIQDDRAERTRLAQEATAEGQKMAQQRAAQAAADQAARNVVLDRLAAERLKQVQTLGEARLAEAARFAKENRDDPQIVPILVAITDLQSVVAGRDSGTIRSLTDALTALLKSDPVYAADAERRRLAEEHEKACNLAEARHLLKIQGDFLIEASRRDPLGRDSMRFMALVKQSREPPVAADLDRAQILVGLIESAIATAGLQTSYALAKADAERSPPPPERGRHRVPALSGAPAAGYARGSGCPAPAKRSMRRESTT